jgi:precorrin-2 dehydrogenase/sirohydrochlorin ferrochelatase
VERGIGLLPIIADVERSAILLAGNGAQTVKRLAMLDAAGCRTLRIFASAPDPALRQAAGPRLMSRWPEPTDFEGVRLAFAGDVNAAEAEAFYGTGRAAGALVNVEDMLPFCDFHVPSIVRRGGLLISISTGGRSPALAQMIRAQIERHYGPEWEDRLDAVAAQRAAWRSQGVSPSEISARTRALALDWFTAPPLSPSQDTPHD